MSFFKPTAGGDGGDNGSTPMETVEGFEGDLSGYEEDTGQASIVSSPVDTGSGALELSDGGSGGYLYGAPWASMIWNPSITDLSPGDTFTFKVRHPAEVNDSGVVIGDYHSNDHYLIGVGWIEGQGTLGFVNSEGSVGPDVDIPISTGEWIEIEVEWLEGPELKATHVSSGTSVTLTEGPSISAGLGWFVIGTQDDSAVAQFDSAGYFPDDGGSQ